MNVRLIVPAAGMGLRLGLAQPKALVLCGGKPLLVRTLERFQPLGLLPGAIITVPPGTQTDFEALLGDAFPDTAFFLVDGGRERQESVENALETIDNAAEIVVIHDAARPFISQTSVQASIDAAEEFGAATVAIPCSDTILVAGADDILADTPDRSCLWACQTPQTFRVDVIRQAHQHARAQCFAATDDATLVRQMGGTVKLVMGSPFNFKVTTPEDLMLAEAIVAKGFV
ncbi:MAG TPA: 2-C-methyl-D-erythritol 4-phosphate cytidylyltransferase [Candidatus Hydrogenedentes bacterium]|mgnify:FL=1|nr:2-C-methyl-D-erythritol 4-phosphate cytidylyltransferase [Candidatus Hydrogenedentota bacterium]